MDGSTVAALAIGIVAALAAVVAAAVALIGLFWKVPEALAKSEQHLGEKIERLGDKFDELNRSVGRVEGQLSASKSPTE